MCEGLDPLAPADENRLADIAAAWTDYLHPCERAGAALSGLGALSCREIWRVRPRCNSSRGRMSIPGASANWRRPIHTNAGMLRERFDCYCEKVIKGCCKNDFLRFDRQIVLVDCLQPLNSGPQAFNDMRLALTQLMQTLPLRQRTLFRRYFRRLLSISYCCCH